MRKTYRSLGQGKSVDLFDGEQQYVYARVLGDEVLVVALNNDAEEARIEFSMAGLSESRGWSFQSDDLLGGTRALRVEDGVGRVKLDGHKGAVFRLPR